MIESGSVVTWSNNGSSVTNKGIVLAAVPANVDALTRVSIEIPQTKKKFPDVSRYSRYIVSSEVKGETLYYSVLATVVEKHNPNLAEIGKLRAEQAAITERLKAEQASVNARLKAAETAAAEAVEMAKLEKQDAAFASIKATMLENDIAPSALITFLKAAFPESFSLTGAVVLSGSKYSAIAYQGQVKSLSEWCKVLNKVEATIRQRLDKGMSPEEAFTYLKGERWYK